MTSEDLKAGAQMMLPSGNIVELVREDGLDWVCRYVRGRSEAMGEVAFSAARLKHWMNMETIR